MQALHTSLPQWVFFTGTDSRLYLQYTFGARNITLLLSPDGTPITQVESEIRFSGFAKAEDGALLGITEDALLRLDAERAQWEIKQALPQRFHQIIPADSSTFEYYAWDDSGLFGILGEKASLLFNWWEIALESHEIRGVLSLDDAFFVVTVDGRLLTVEQTDVVPTIVQFAVLGRDARLVQRVRDFNQSQTAVLVELIDLAMEEDLLRAQMEIMSGGGPDIIPTSMVSASHLRLARSGVFADILPLLDADPVLSREALVQFALSALSYSGGLYQVVPSFWVETYAGRREVVEQLSEQSFLQLLDAVLAGDETVRLFLDMTRYQFLRHISRLHLDRYIDWETAAVNFDSDEFIRVLDVAAALPAQLAFVEGQPLLVETLAFDQVLLRDFYAAQLHAFLYGPDFLYWSFGQPPLLGYNFSFGISSASNRQEEAWLFLREFLLPADPNREMGRDDWMDGFSINQESFERQMREAQTANIRVDENGEAYISYHHMQRLPDGREIAIYAATEAQIRRVLDALESATRVSAYDPAIWDMLLEEALPFFHGDRTAADTARIMQSRAQTYIAEQM